MPATDPRVLAFALLVGLALAVNPLWLFPDDGEPRYTYDAVELSPAGDRIEYGPGIDPTVGEEYNDLERVGCDGTPAVDGVDRLCAFERSVLKDGPVTVTGERPRADGRPRYVELEDGYYERVADANGTAVTLDLRPVPARAVLSGVSVAEVGHLEAGHVDASQVALRVAVTGESVRTDRPPSDVDVGVVYRSEARYLTVFLTDVERLDRPLVAGWSRGLVSLIGLVLVSAVLTAPGGGTRTTGDHNHD